MVVIHARKLVKKFLFISLLICVSIMFAALLIKPSELFGLKNDNQAKSASKTVAGTVNEVNAVAVSVPDFYAEYRIERDRLRSERTDLLREAAKNGKIDDNLRQKAQDAIIKITLDRQKELEMENLIKAKGFSDALIFIRENSVNAIIKTNILSKEEVLQIADIIAKSTGIRPENITISTKL